MINVMEQVDRRVRRTRRSLEEALVALTLEKEYEEITIQEITERADVGYRTFFRHYADKDELLKDVLDSTMMELRELMSPPTPEVMVDPDFKAADFKEGVFLFQHVKNHCDLYRVLLRSERTFIESVIAFAVQSIEGNLSPLVKSDFSIEIVANHMAWATIALVRWWLDSDMPYPPEVMGEYTFRLVVKPVREMILQMQPTILLDK
jgi:AcrR family transcriptional regulator